VLGGQGLMAAVPAALLRRTAGLAAATGPALAGALLPRRTGAVGLVVAGLLGGGLLLSAGGPPKPPGPNEGPKPAAAVVERRDDPLPAGAVARLGTGWLRGYRCQFLPGGRAVVRERERPEGGLQIFEAPTGKPLARIRAADVPGRDTIVGST